MKVRLRDCVQLVKSRVSTGNAIRENYVSTDNMIVNRGGVNFGESSLPQSKTVNDYQKGDVLVSNIRPYFKKIWFADRDGTRSSDVLCFRKTDESLTDEYLYCILQSDHFFDYVVSTSKGTKMPRGDKEAILEYEFDLPNKEVQYDKCHPILLVEQKMTLNKKINDNLLELAKELYRKTLASSILTETKLKDFATITMGQSPSSKTYNEDKVGIALLNGAADFRNGIHPSKWTTDPKRVVDKGAYIFGVRATIGLTTKIFDKYAIGRGTGSAIPKDMVNDEFLYFVLDNMFKYFASSGSGSVYINISKSDFNDYVFYKPQTSDLQTFHQTVGPMMNNIYANKQENLVLTQVKETLLNKYF